MCVPDRGQLHVRQSGHAVWLLHGPVGIVGLQRYLKAYRIAVHIAGHWLLHLLIDPYCIRFTAQISQQLLLV